VKFNLQTAVFEERFRTTIAPRLMLGHWLRYQVKRSRIAYLPAYRRCANRKAPLRCVAEAALLTIRWRCLPFHYFRYGLYGTSYSLGTVFSYLPETVFYYRLLSKLNRDTLLLDDKLVCKRILGAAGVPQARLLLSGEGERCYNSIGVPIALTSAGSLDHMLKEGQRVVMKPARYSSGGDGVMVLTYEDGSFRSRSGQAISLSRYGATWGAWLMEEFVCQHADLAVLNASSLNTLRVITTWGPEPGAQVHFCILKLSANAGLTDNAHSGGLYLRVDMDTGELADTGFDESFARHAFHPWSGVVFEGYRIDMINEVVALAKLCAALFPQTLLVGWDIAISEDGPLVIEGNSSPGLTNVQRTHGGVAHTLGQLLKKSLSRGETDVLRSRERRGIRKAARRHDPGPAAQDPGPDCPLHYR
jgi:hypothetical protein